MSKDTEKLNEFLINAIDEALNQIFLVEDVETVYSYLENRFHLKREEIAGKLDVFARGLEDLLGSTRSLETLILERLHSKLFLGLEDKKDYRLSEFLRKLGKSNSVQTAEEPAEARGDFRVVLPNTST